MKKTLLLLAIALVPFTANAGFVGTSDQAILSVAQVKKMGNDKPVVMKGSIEKHISKDKYQFIDDTGKVVVEIDGEEWRGIDITPNDTVILIGETDKDWLRNVEVDVSSIHVITDQVKAQAKDQAK